LSLIASSVEVMGFSGSANNSKASRTSSLSHFQSVPVRIRPPKPSVDIFIPVS
jgi:hypothetical protein